MPERRVSLFCEDRGHESVGVALIRRVAREKAVQVTVTTLSARGGKGRALSELKAWQRLAAANRAFVPDLLVVLHDSNCTPWNAVRQQVLSVVDEAVVPAAAIGCPDPHVERWLLADPAAFGRVIGVEPAADPGKCEREAYKKIVGEALAESGEPVLVDLWDVAAEIVDEMDLHRASRRQSSLRHFLRDLRASL
jgi:hypothetical protein